MIFTNIVPRVSETDGVGHINNVFVPIWFEAGRREIFRIFSPKLDFLNWKLALVKVTVEYVDQLYLAEEVEIRTGIEKIGNSSFTIKEEIHQSGAKILSEEIGKSIDFVMVILHSGCSLSFAQDSQTPCAYLEVKNVGKLPGEKTQRLSNKLTSLICDKLRVRPEQIYIEFQESERHLWGWNGATFEK